MKKTSFALLSFFLALFFWEAPAFSQTDSSPEWYGIDVKSTVNPGTLAFIEYGIREATAKKATGIVIGLNTPGGLLTATRDIVSAITTSKIPVVVYVGPQGASATSAGAFILLSAHVAVMNVGTNVGAAHPVGGQGEDVKGAMGDKVMNDTVAFMRSITQARGRNVLAAESMVNASRSFTAEDAFQTKLVNLVVNNEAELLEKLDGQKVKLENGEEITFANGKQAKLIKLEPRVKDRLLMTLAHPQIAYLLFMAGLLGLYVEFTSAGSVIFPGIAGAISLILGLVSLQALPLSFGGLALLLLGACLLIAEIFIPAFGVLGIGGIVSFVFGSLFLFDRNDPTARVSVMLISSTVITLALVMLFLGLTIIRARRKNKPVGLSEFSGAKGIVLQQINGETGKIKIRDEMWAAITEDGSVIETGSHVVPLRRKGATLIVRKDLTSKEIKHV